MTSTAPTSEPTSAESLELAAYCARRGLKLLAADEGAVHPGVRAHAIAALTQHEAVRALLAGDPIFPHTPANDPTHQEESE